MTMLMLINKRSVIDVQETRELLFWFTRKTHVDSQKAQAAHYFKSLIEPETFPTGHQRTYYISQPL